MSETKLVHIKRTEIPNNLKSKNELRKLRLRPAAPPVAFTYQQHGFIYYLYDISDTKPMKRATENQLKALEQGRIKRLTCKRCGEVQYSVADLNKEKLCWGCEVSVRRELHEKYKRKLSDQCKEFLSSDKYLILDTETTGLHPLDEIVEISIINTKGDILFNSLIKPTQNIPEEATNIHGITDDMVWDAPTWDEVWNQIKEIMMNKTLLIYNSSFDVRMILQTCQKYNIKTPKYEIDENIGTYCIMNMYMDYEESESWISLQNACSWEKIDIEQNHRATGDCYMVLELIRKIAYYN